MKFVNLFLSSTLLCSTATAFAPSCASTTRHSSLCQSDSDGDAALNDSPLQDRRSVLSSVAAIGLASASGLAAPLAIPAAQSDRKSDKPRKYFKGKITLKDDEATKQAVLGNYKAIFVSARPKNPASIPPEVVRSAGAGGVPAVFFAAIPNPSNFPVEFKLTENDITPEGDFGLTSDPYWWSEDAEWEISVRADTDGVVRTLDGSDLVGRTITSQPGETAPDTEVCIALKERGFFGSYFQRKQT